MSQKRQVQHNPIQRLENSVGKSILIKVKKNRLFAARKLLSFDNHLNLYVEDCTQIYEVENENGEMIQEKQELGDILIRGDNIIFIEFG
ncbi:MAG: LSM domain-containing protein [Promethearchaeota archaeon]